MPTGWRSACELALVATFLVGCASAGVSAQRIPFIDHGSTQQSANDGGPLLVVAADNATRTELVRLYPNTPPDPGRVYLGVFAGTQRTGGYAVSVDAVERVADRLNIRSTFTVPPSAALKAHLPSGLRCVRLRLGPFLTQPLKGRPLAASHNRALPASSPVKINRPSALNSPYHTEPGCGISSNNR